MLVLNEKKKKQIGSNQAGKIIVDILSLLE